jgi:hypothetical protein
MRKGHLPWEHIFLWPDHPWNIFFPWTNLFLGTSRTRSKWTTPLPVMSPCWKSLDLVVKLKQSLRSLCWILQVIINERLSVMIMGRTGISSRYEGDLSHQFNIIYFCKSLNKAQPHTIIYIYLYLLLFMKTWIFLYLFFRISLNNGGVDKYFWNLICCWL